MKYTTKEILAKTAIEHYQKNQQILPVSQSEVPVEFHSLGGSFIALYQNQKLHGCVGNYQADRPIFESIVRNSVAAAFEDLRFHPLMKKDLDKVMIKVSILSPLQEVNTNNFEGFLEWLEVEKPGLLLEKDGREALFLPLVWEFLPSPKEFLSQLCLKADFSPLDWNDPTIRYWAFKTS